MVKMDSTINNNIVTKCKNYETKPYVFNYTFKDTILYNLAVGASVDAEDLK